MAGCLKALGFWKKKSKGVSAAVTDEKPRVEKNPSLEVRHVHGTHPPRGIPVRPDVNPEYSAYSTPVDTTWADSTTSTKAAPDSDNHAVDSEDAARRKKAEQEEQERLDFFQMM